MPKLSSADLKSILAAQKADALSAMQASKLSNERANAMDYYMGDVSKEMPSLTGRSKAVSSDVSDTIEGLMPSLMEVFCGSNDVVKFEPVGPEDVEAAEQETDYINHVFMQQNPGFLVLYSFIKDALLSKVGVVKVWWEETEEEDRQTYLDQPDDAYAILISAPDVEVVEHSEHPAENYNSGQPVSEAPEAAPVPPPGAPPAGGLPAPSGGPPAPILHDVTIARTRKCTRARVEGVPPEEFGISRHARAISTADYCYHEVQRSQGDLIAQGYDAKQIKGLPTYNVLTGIEQQSRDTVEETSNAAADIGEESSRLILITEHYCRLDMDDDDKPALWRITTGGTSDGDILQRDGQDDCERVDVMPFAAMTPVIITHRFFGRSIADLVMDIQRIKTALLRAMLDNAYLANNPRTEVSESHASANTLDDLLISRPGGIVRTKMPGGLVPLITTDISASVLPQLAYFDATREWRTGVTRQGQGLDPETLQNTTATTASIMESAAQQKMKLIARIFAETGIRDMFSLLHGTIRKHGSQAATVRLRNRWVQVDPRDWRRRNDMTITVGLGSGGQKEEIAGLTMIIGAQEKAILGGAGMVSGKNLYNSAAALCRALRYKDPGQFFVDPAAPPNPQDPTSAPIQKPADPKAMEIQMKAEIEKLQATADIETKNRQQQGEMAIAQQKFTLESQQSRELHAQKMEEHRVKMAGTLIQHATRPATNGQDGPAQSSPDPELLKALMAAMHPPTQHKPMRARKQADGSWITEPMQ